MTNYTSLNPLNTAALDGRMALQNRDRFLVERDADGAWQLADPTDRVVLGDQLVSDFGFWKDAELKKNGMLWNSTIRPLNSRIDEDEVIPMSQAMSQSHDHQRFMGQEHFDTIKPMSATLVMSPEGAELATDWTVQRSMIGFEASQTNDMLIAGDSQLRRA